MSERDPLIPEGQTKGTALQFLLGRLGILEPTTKAVDAVVAADDKFREVTGIKALNEHMEQWQQEQDAKYLAQALKQGMSPDQAQKSLVQHKEMMQLATDAAGMSAGISDVGRKLLGKAGASAMAREGFGGTKSVAEQESGILNRLKSLLKKEEPLPPLEQQLSDRPNLQTLEGPGFEARNPVAEGGLIEKSPVFESDLRGASEATQPGTIFKKLLEEDQKAPKLIGELPRSKLDKLNKEIQGRNLSNEEFLEVLKKARQLANMKQPSKMGDAQVALKHLLGASGLEKSGFAEDDLVAAARSLYKDIPHTQKVPIIHGSRPAIENTVRELYGIRNLLDNDALGVMRTDMNPITGTMTPTIGAVAKSEVPVWDMSTILHELEHAADLNKGVKKRYTPKVKEAIRDPNKTGLEAFQQWSKGHHTRNDYAKRSYELGKLEELLGMKVGDKGLVLPKEPQIISPEPLPIRELPPELPPPQSPVSAPPTRGQILGGLPFYPKKAADTIYDKFGNLLGED